ncbi:protein kinase [Micromonospora echinofusca]|uniref:non-specific serine/threonine protein kinase n=2 Tax=Micromonospora echinofusca TaxID=47858 RepID=A0ABS3W1Q3_MICEH|nr:protein kinase [Micromonospora echinofusca]
MGDVWRGTDVVLGREVAVKVLLPALVSDPDFIARFRAEARMMAALRHPGIVQVFDCGEDALADGGRADYLVMEFVDGEPLSRRIEAAGQLGVAETMSVVAQAAQALHAAHNRGIVHRDVKPSNLLVQPDGTVVLVDFGVARSTNVTSITSTNAVPGTALYMAPEQAAGRPVSAATDIYALGAVAYCCLTGGPPFTGDNPLQVAVRHLDDEPAPLPPEIPAPVAELVSRALAKDPADRFPSAAAFAEAARAARQTLPGTPAAAAAAGAGTGTADLDPHTLTDQPAVGGGAAGPRGRRTALVGAVAAALVGLTGLAFALGFQSDTSPPATNLPQQGPAPSATADAPATEPVATEEVRSDRPSGPRSTPSVSPTAVPTGAPSGPVAPEPSPTGSPDPVEPTTAPSDPVPSDPPTPVPSQTAAPGGEDGTTTG